MCNKIEAIIILNEVIERTRALFGNSLINGYLYGSYARGDYDEESDVDILLTVDQSDEAIRAHNKSLAKIDSDLSLDHNVTVSVTVKPLEQFNRFAEISPFYKNVINEGICHAGN
ncbi:DNA polymerase subunit beta [Ruminococcus albus SY3]|uniref:DNA polymerase subunit beta n=1 Tax=Ruminococcus albus SY3 TaxID=1341156 RepID=A0A011WSB2_RUMAL|nr:nucleotidyltransferase domain-containing protein [Ruminococcus albus]EXM39900.1 DNA polymerase subunit beta [Ruminococcus albus SY3]